MRVGRRLAAACAILAVLQATTARADYVVRDRGGKRLETLVERPGGALIRQDPRGRRLGYAERSAGNLVLRDEAGRRIGTVQGAGAPGGLSLAPQAPAGGLVTGVVRDRRGRRIGTIELR